MYAKSNIADKLTQEAPLCHSRRPRLPTTL